MQKLKAIIEPKSFDHAREELTVLVERKVGKADIENRNGKRNICK